MGFVTELDLGLSHHPPVRGISSRNLEYKQIRCYNTTKRRDEGIWVSFDPRAPKWILVLAWRSTEPSQLGCGFVSSALLHDPIPPQALPRSWGSHWSRSRRGGSRESRQTDISSSLRRGRSDVCYLARGVSLVCKLQGRFWQESQKALCTLGLTFHVFRSVSCLSWARPSEGPGLRPRIPRVSFVCRRSSSVDP